MATQGISVAGGANASTVENVMAGDEVHAKGSRLVAQAQAGEPSEPQLLDPATGGPVEGALAATPAPDLPEIVKADAANIVRLPAGISLENIKVIGNDVVLEQPDGTTIRIVNAALNVPTFVIGDAEIPRETLVAVLEGNGINVAAGPDGTISVVSGQSSGGNFSNNNADIGDAGPVIDLLSPTELQFGAVAQEEELSALLDPNDAPDLALADAGMVTEDVSVGGDGNLTTSGTISATDADANDTLTISSAPHGEPSWSDGTLTQAQINTLLAGFSATESGWSYQVPNALVQFLDAGETITLNFDVTVTDDSGATDTQTVTITIHGTNDAPVIEATANRAVTEDVAVDGSGNLTTSGTITLADVDTNETLTVTSAPSGQPSWNGGSLTHAQIDTLLAGFNATSTGWNYQVPNALVQFLGDGETITLSFDVTVTDDNGATDTETVTITINGTNDAPVIGDSSVTSGSVTEAGLAADDATPVTGPSTATGTMVSSDVDNGATATWSGSASGSFGSFVITAGGAWTYTLDNGLADSLAEGETRTETFVVTVTDDNGATDTETVTITINGTNDAPVIAATASGAVTEDVNVIGGNLSTSGTITTSDVDAGDTLTVSSAPAGPPVWSNGTLTQTQINGLTAGFTATGSGWNYQVPNSLVQFLDAGETITLSYEVTVTDAHGATDSQTVTVTINGTNDAPVVASTCVWLPSDPGQQGSEYASGYPLMVSTPTDVDGENVVVTATNSPNGVYYFDGTTFVAVANGTVLYDPANGVNLLDNLVYQPTSTVNDTPAVSLGLSASDGSATTSYSVTINEVAPNRLPASEVTIGGGTSALNSGSSITNSMAVTQGFADSINSNLAAATIKVLTDFQRAPFDTPIPVGERDPNGFNDSGAGTAREKELQVELWIGANKFVIVEADTTAAKFEQSWSYDAGTGLMAATVSYSNIYLLNGSGQPTATTLAQYLTQNPLAAGDQWVVSYRDNDGGNFQGRTARFEFYYNDPGDPGIVVVGDDSKSNLIYGTSGADNLTGGALADTIIGRGGNDVINGGGGNDTLRGGAGNDTIDGGGGMDLLDLSDATGGVTFSLVQSSGSTVANLTAVGLGVDTYRNIEGIIGSDYNDTLTGSAFGDQLYGGEGSDRLTGGAGADTFVIADDELQVGIHDVITDYHASEGDAVDLSALLGNLSSDTLGQHVQLVQDGANANLQVDTDGSGGGAGWQTVAVLENFSVSTDVVKILFNDDHGSKTTGEA